MKVEFLDGHAYVEADPTEGLVILAVTERLSDRENWRVCVVQSRPQAIAMRDALTKAIEEIGGSDG
jgi:hypothetical protein